jgi:membrane protease YdiL (CAAX protease family)
LAAVTPLEAWVGALGTTAVAATACWLVCRPEQAGTRRMLGLFSAAQLGLAAFAVTWLRHRGELRRLRPARGDVTIGFALAVVLYGIGYALSRLATSPASPIGSWLIRIYLQLGDPVLTAALPVGVAVMMLGACEEIAWRGGVMTALGAVYGPARAWWLTALLQAVAYAPTVVLLADPVRGPNPVLVVGTLVVGLGWGWLVRHGVQLAPIVISHALLAWGLVEWRLWQP